MSDILCEQLELYRGTRASVGHLTLRHCTGEARERALTSEMAAEGTLHPGLRALPASRTAAVRARIHLRGWTNKHLLGH
jgi:hypothetical protein